MSFTEQLWEQNCVIYQKILHHPFNQELIHGTLDTVIFAYYIEQDSLYLHMFSKTLALIATKLEDMDAYLQILRNALDTIVLERDVVHAHFKKQLNIQDSNRITTATLGYTNQLLTTAYQKQLEVGLASILPCFWIYHRLGIDSLLHVTTDNPYKTWIDTYSSEEFRYVVNNLLHLIEYYANNTTPAIRDAMSLAFTHSCIWEYRFWDNVYTLEVFDTI